MNREQKRELHNKVRHMAFPEFVKWLDDYANDAYHLAEKHAQLAMEFTGYGPKRQQPIADAWQRAIQYDGIKIEEAAQ